MSLDSQKPILGANKVSTPAKRIPVRSLRLQLLFWYGLLVAISLGLFAALLLGFATNALTQNVSHAVSTESRLATYSLSKELKPDFPYWPAKLAIPALDVSYSNDVFVEVLDKQGKSHYRSDATPSIPIAPSTLQSVYAGGIVSSIIPIKQERWQTEISPVYVPLSSTTSDRPIIGILVVAKSLANADQTIFLLQSLLTLVGLSVLALSLLIVWVIATRVLRPLADIMQTARSIASSAHGMHIGGLGLRVARPSNRGHDEVVQVVDTLNDMLDALEKASLAQRRFVADASHELRAPLTTIQGNLAFLQRHYDEFPPAERQVMLSDAYAETLRLSQLVNELLLLARADAGVDSTALHGEDPARDAEAEPQVIEWDRVLLQLVRQLRGRLLVDSAPHKLNIGHIEPVRVYGNEEALRRILLILIDNALKYSSAEEDRGVITVSLERSDSEAVCRVQDNGIGIEATDLPHLFERFYRADRARSRQGTGLGLSIAQTLVEQLHGRITVESTAGQGSVFSIYLPFVAAHS